jgi:hypothetical protein
MSGLLFREGEILGGHATVALNGKIVYDPFNKAGVELHPFENGMYECGFFFSEPKRVPRNSPDYIPKYAPEYVPPLAPTAFYSM